MHTYKIYTQPPKREFPSDFLGEFSSREDVGNTGHLR